MNIILFDDPGRTNLLPLCYTRPCGELRVGILTISEKWKAHLNAEVSHLTQDYLSHKYPTIFEEENLYINGRLLIDSSIVSALQGLELDKSLSNDNGILAYRSKSTFQNYDELQKSFELSSTTAIEADTLDFSYDIFKKNEDQLRKDFEILTKDKKSQKISETNILIGENIFVEEGASIEAAVLNSKEGPIYIGKNATIMEGSLIKGPFAICANSTIKMGAKIYGGTTVGPQCKIGGEVSNTVFYANSNKGHDGYIGNSVIGEWCNLGADTNSSNLKNNYAEVKLWNYPKGRFITTGLQFCGLIMGDHSKCGINTMFNTGTVVGVSANIFGASFPRNFIPSYTWGGASGFATYSMTKAFETAKIVMARRGQELNEIEKNILIHIFNESANFRFWESKSINT